MRGKTGWREPGTGQAETPVHCPRALQLARSVAGLARVSNHIAVRQH